MKAPYGKLFGAFLQVGWVAFGGGGNAGLYQAIVLERGWMEERGFLETIALCRVLPGPVFANAGVHLGMRLGGILALLEVLIPGAILTMRLGFVWHRPRLAGRERPEWGSGGGHWSDPGHHAASGPRCAGLC